MNDFPSTSENSDGQCRWCGSEGPRLLWEPDPEFLLDLGLDPDSEHDEFLFCDTECLLSWL